ncbi:MAG: TonB-dependent receptor domain-containing protein, partial [Vulcanimicrobiaceae bacterium]
FNPTRFLKFEYDYNVTPNTLLQARYYNWETLQGNQDLTGFTGNTPASLGLGSYPVWSQTGGQRTGAIVDITQQIGSRSTTTISGNYDDSHIVWDEFDPNAEVFELALSDLFGRAGPAYSDFLPGGYLSSFFPGGVPRIPVSGINYNGALFHSYGIGVREQYAATDRLKFDIGGRFDQQIQDYGYNPLNPTLPGNPSDVNPAGITPTYLEPHELQPRAAVSYQAGPNDAFRASYGRSIIFLNGQTAGTPAGFYNYQPFLNVPAKPGGFQCGSGVAGAPPVPCQNYAQQLYWLYDQNFDAPDLGAALPAIYSNYDFSYSHQFNNGFAFKVTPFYKLGVHLPSFALVTSLAAGAAVFTVNNEGINRTTGVEFGLTSPDRPYGLSGFLTATYQNVLGSTPPLVGGEDALPINGSGSLGLGDVYRAGYVSPFSTRIGFEYKMRNGLSIIPIIQYDRGYPFNIGNTIASSCLINGAFHNVQQVNFGCGVTQIPAYQAQTGTAASTNYYDPAYSGNTLNPNIAGTRGTPETASAGGALYKANVEANLTVQYKAGRSTFGVLISNLFGNQYNGVIPTINPYYQPVANGLSGPQTGANPYAPLYPNRGFANVPSNAYAFTNGAYLLIPNAPTSFQFYYQLGL